MYMWYLWCPKKRKRKRANKWEMKSPRCLVKQDMPKVRDKNAHTATHI